MLWGANSSMPGPGGGSSTDVLAAVQGHTLLLFLQQSPFFPPSLTLLYMLSPSLPGSPCVSCPPHPPVSPFSLPPPQKKPTPPPPVHNTDGDPGTSIILAEDKKYYPTAEETYGTETETLLMEEDAQPLETPIIAPVVAKKLEKALEVPLATSYSTDYLATLSSNPELIRNVAVSEGPLAARPGQGEGAQGGKGEHRTNGPDKGGCIRGAAVCGTAGAARSS